MSGRKGPEETARAGFPCDLRVCALFVCGCPFSDMPPAR